MKSLRLAIFLALLLSPGCSLLEPPTPHPTTLEEFNKDMMDADIDFPYTPYPETDQLSPDDRERAEYELHSWTPPQYVAPPVFTLPTQATTPTNIFEFCPLPSYCYYTVTQAAF